MTNPPEPEADLVVTEGIHGTFSYHLSERGRTARGLCGMSTMITHIPVSAWGTKSHLNERWCPTCAESLP